MTEYVGLALMKLSLIGLIWRSIYLGRKAKKQRVHNAISKHKSPRRARRGLLCFGVVWFRQAQLGCGAFRAFDCFKR